MYKKFNKDCINNHGIFTSVLKIPIREGLPSSTFGKIGNVIFNANNDTFYGHTGIQWVPFNGGGGGENLNQTLLIGNDTSGRDINLTNGDTLFVYGNIDISNNGNIVTPSNSNTDISNGFIKITGINGVPNGNPGLSGGQLAWNENTQDVFIHTGGGTWKNLTTTTTSSATNIGDGSEVYVTGTSDPFEFRTFTSPDSSINIDQSGTEIQLTSGYTRREINVSGDISSTDDILAVDTSSSDITLRLPSISDLNTSNNYKKYIVVDEGGNASNNNITIVASSEDTIIGLSQPNGVVINQNYNSLSIYSNGSNGWFIY